MTGQHRNGLDRDVHMAFCELPRNQLEQASARKLDMSSYSHAIKRTLAAPPFPSVSAYIL